MNILGLDLGTHTGYAYNVGNKFFCGTWDLATKDEITEWGKSRMTRRSDPRVCRLLARLAIVGPMDAIVFEDVQFASSTYQTQLWAGLRSCVWFASCQDIATILECVPVQTLKKFATSHGGATKDMMATALVKQDNRFTFQKVKRKQVVTYHGAHLTDDAVDAIFVHKWAIQNLSRI